MSTQIVHGLCGVCCYRYMLQVRAVAPHPHPPTTPPQPPP